MIRQTVKNIPFMVTKLEILVVAMEKNVDFLITIRNIYGFHILFNTINLN